MFRYCVCALAIILGAGCSAGPAQAGQAAPTPPWSQTQEAEILDFLDTASLASGAPPVFMVVTAAGDGTVLTRLQGRTGGGPGGAPVDSHSPFYIASITKAYVGLMAAVLDQRRVLDLDSTVAELAPDLTFPQGLDPEAITLRQLLSHSGHLNAPDLNFRTANIGAVDDATFVRLMRASQRTESDFRYTNTGYLLYAWLLERKTGRSWRDWLEETVLSPLGLTETSARSSSFDPDETVWGHQLAEEGWLPLKPKADEALHAAGGLYTSARDAGRWLVANLQSSDLPATAWAEHRKVVALTDTEVLGASCYGYALGLMACDYGGYDVRLHLGSFAGWRSVMSYAPELGVGVYVVAGSDHMAQIWSTVVERQIYDIIRGVDGRQARSAERLHMFESEAARLLEERAAARDSVFRTALPQTDLVEGMDPLTLVGWYGNDLMGSAEVAIDGTGQLTLQVGAYGGLLQALGGGRYALMDGSAGAPDVITFEEGDLRWNDYVFRRDE